VKSFGALSHACHMDADFSQMTPGGGVKISEVKHRTYVDVNEEGTTAAAVMSVGIVPTIRHPATQ